MIIGAALGSIIANVIAPHIAAMIVKLIALQAPLVSGRHSASNRPVAAVIRPRASHPRPASAITQTAASTFGRANAAPNRPAAGERWERSWPVVSLICPLNSALRPGRVPEAAGVVSAPPRRVLIG